MVIFAHQNHTNNEDKQNHGRDTQHHVPGDEDADGDVGGHCQPHL